MAPLPTSPGAPLKIFAENLLEALRRSRVRTLVRNETDFKRRFLEPLVWDLAAKIKNVRVATPPWGSKRHCSPDCDQARAGDGTVQHGCHVCWHDSKALWSVGTHGTHHSFDIVVADATQRLAVEAKFVKVRNGRMPNDGIQRFFGQCVLAAAKGARVIGVVGYQGHLSRKPSYNADTKTVEEWFRKVGVELSFVKIPPQPIS